jgi:hypothetical protein
LKAYVMQIGEGLALPLPSNLAAALGLRPGSAVELHGPGPDGSLRYVPEPDTEAPADARPAETHVASRELPSPAEVVQAVSAKSPAVSSRSARPGGESEIGGFVTRHEAILREVGP